MFQSVNRRLVLFALLFLGPWAIHPLLAGWVWSDPLPQGHALQSIAVSPSGSRVAVGDAGTVVLRHGDESWRALPPMAGGADLSAVVWDGSRFLATGPQAGLWVSADGSKWELLDATVNGRFLFVATGAVVCLGKDAVWTSPAAGAPFQQQSPVPGGLSLGASTAAVSMGEVLVVRPDGTLAMTSNGVVWTVPNFRANTSFYTVAGGEAGFLFGAIDRSGSTPAPVLALREAGSGAVSSIPLPANADFRMFRLLPSPAGWLFVDYRAERILRRVGGEWSPVPSPVPGIFPNAALALPGGDTLLAGDRGALARLSNTGTLALESASQIASSFLYTPRFAVAGLGDVSAAIDKNVSRARDVRLYTLDTSNAWSMPSPPPVEGLTTLASVGNRLVGYSIGTPATNPGFYAFAGTSWEPLAASPDSNAPFEGEVLSFAADSTQDTILALVREQIYDLDLSYSASRALYRSSNWIDWSPVSLPALRDLQPPSEDNPESLFWDGTQFVLLLHPGRIFLSGDGRRWTSLPALPADSKEKLAADFPGLNIPASNHAVSVASDGSRLVARAAKLAPDGSLLGEIPGTLETFFVFDMNRWWPVSVAPAVDPSKRLVLWNGSRFHAIGDGAILASNDGFHWTSQPVPSDLASLVWTGSRFLGFTDSFAVLAHEGQLPAGDPVGLPLVSPRLKTLDSSAQNYQIQTPSTGSPVALAGIPPWISTIHSPDHSTLTVSVSGNPDPNPRGAVLSIGGQPHLVSQLGTRTPSVLSANPGPSTLTIPFSGDWSASASSSVVAFPKNATTGKGNLRLSIPANPTPTARTFIVNMNGLDFTIEQAGQLPAALRVGTYSGPVGWLAQGASPASADSFESIDGRIEITVASPTRNSPHGSYSASLSIFDGNRTLRFSGKGALGTDGTLAGQWKTSTKGVPPAEISLILTDDHAITRFFSGNISAAGSSYGILAGKNIFHPKSNPLSASETGRATAFLTSFPTLDAVVDIGVASASILPSGAVRWVGTLANGAKLSASSFVWGAAGPSLALPFSFALPSGSGLVSGLASRTPASPSFDWSGGPTTWLARGQTPIYGWSHLAAYTPPLLSRPALDWTAPAAFSLSGENLEGTEGDILFSQPASLRASLPGGTASLKITPATGLVTGSFSLPGSKKPAALLFGAVNQKYRDSSTGSILGFATGESPGQFSAFPK